MLLPQKYEAASAQLFLLAMCVNRLVSAPFVTGIVTKTGA
jgi:hypothetical protein